jgi:carbamoyltransferase
MRVLGIHDGHNASAVLLEDGRISYAVQEERLNRIKNYQGFPFESVGHLLELSSLRPADIDIVAMASLHYPIPRTREEMLAHYRASTSPKALGIELLKRTPAKKLHRGRRRNQRLADIERAGLDTSRVEFVEHHTCHASAAYWGSPWRGEPVLVMTCDGAGDDISAAVSIAHPDGELERIAHVAEDSSLGGLYATVTFALGLTPNDHEYKLMGLAPYAPTAGAEAVLRQLEGLFSFDEDALGWKRSSGTPHIYHALGDLQKLIAFHRFDSIAAGVQLLVERMLIRWVRAAVRETGLSKVALGGGVFMNVKANKSILELPEIEQLFVFPSCGDETNSIGAAFEVYAQRRRDEGEPVDITPIRDLYWGKSFTLEEIEEQVRAFEFTGPVTIRQEQNIGATVSEFLNRGEVVARCTGRMEFGARALGNRSIMANAGDWRVVKIINEMIKQRDFWMPFAPSILGECASDYLLKPKDVEAPYMILSFDTVPDKIERVIAAVHPYDGTARPQEVYREWNEGYYEVLEGFRAKTGEGVILNTSFNLHGSPIVYSPTDALKVFMDSGLRHLVLGEFVISKE